MKPDKLAVLGAVRIANSVAQLAPVLLPLIERAMEAGEEEVSLEEVEDAAIKARVDLAVLHQAIAEREERDAGDAA